MRRVDRLFRLYMVALFLLTLGGIYTTIFVAEGFWARVGVFLGWGSLVYLGFMGGVFWFAAWANQIGLSERRPDAQPDDARADDAPDPS